MAKVFMFMWWFVVLINKHCNYREPLRISLMPVSDLGGSQGKYSVLDAETFSLLTQENLPKV